MRRASPHMLALEVRQASLGLAGLGTEPTISWTGPLITAQRLDTSGSQPPLDPMPGSSLDLQTVLLYGGVGLAVVAGGLLLLSVIRKRGRK